MFSIQQLDLNLSQQDLALAREISLDNKFSFYAIFLT